jgi:UDP-N-acetylmuramyl pentapeptide phosphotransferase/UDP-N-acetylglucosamine-1-phosphate transferase
LLDIKQTHKINFKKKIVLSGGFYILLSLIISKYFFNFQINEDFILVLFCFFLLGFFSDIKPKLSPKIRLSIQISLIIMYLYFFEIQIYKTNIFFIDYFIHSFIFNLFFTTFCVVVFLNGSNFIDGVNTNLIGYYLIILLIISIYYSFEFELIYVIISLFIFLLFNLFGKCFLGDNGVYVLSILISFIIIKLINLNSLNPIIAINLLWYPAFENLFTILRRSIVGVTVDIADKKHLHTLLYKFYKRKFKKDLFSNSLSGITLNIYNFISIFISFKYMNNMQILASVIILNIIIYLIVYFKLLKILSNEEIFKK